MADFPDIQLLADWTFYFFPFQALSALVLACSWADTLENVDFIEI
jgi:hypothetical protein